MKYIYSNDHTITYSEIDSNLKFGIISTFLLVQDMMTSYYGYIGSDNITIKEKNNALWVLTRTKVKFNKNLAWGDKIKGTTCTTRLKPIRMELETVFNDESDEQVFIVSQQLCPIDMITRKIRKIDTVEFPKDMECVESVYSEESLNLNIEFNEDEKVYEPKIMFSDIDLSNHTNNVSYVKFILNTLSSEFFRNHIVDVFEIQYIHESMESDVLSIYKKEFDNNIYFLVKCGENEVARAGIKLK